MSQEKEVPVILDHPTDPDLRGPVTFRQVDAYTSISIQRRVTELINLGRDPKLSKIHPLDIGPEGYALAVKVATLEHVIVTAPRGLYGVVGGKAVLRPGALVEFEAEEEDGAINLLYDAYVTWRLRFRQRRRGDAQGADGDAGSADGGSSSATGGP